MKTNWKEIQNHLKKETEKQKEELIEKLVNGPHELDYEDTAPYLITAMVYDLVSEPETQKEFENIWVFYKENGHHLIPLDELLINEDDLKWCFDPTEVTTTSKIIDNAFLRYLELQ